ncbi:Xylose operon regulatory protein [Caulifigura coniformis]|uniref:Xylose operon regulatory protein n=1 Tax=Caulifigura coniformis TaxID=2527983 RepID=A0A517SJT1_9PLAN|nr:DNA-binding transcriptional regulator [Caulifigura coniformis]QDT56375.1 Xylose operon regulatory protein [Caulifigura coniformis]
MLERASRARSRRPRIALLIEYSNGYARELLRGIVAYVREHDSWSLLLPENEPGFDPLAPFPKQRVDGIIARVFDPALGRRLSTYEVPVVDVSGGRNFKFGSWVSINDRRLVRLGIDHLIERGFTRFAFYGDHRFQWSHYRETEFRDYANELGLESATFQPSTPLARNYSWSRADRELRAWVASLPKPVGVLTGDDLRGQQLLDACRSASIAVPEQVAVVGADNDELICELCEPRLSSVVPNTFRGGYLAGQLLDRMLSRGRGDSWEGIEIFPERVECRGSSDVLAFEDQLVARAVTLIREKAGMRLSVEDLARELDVSRRTLDIRFVDALRRTPHDEITRVRIGRVKTLLLSTSLPLSVIAAQTGFDHVEYFCAAFKREVGVTPGAYRNSHGVSAAGLGNALPAAEKA